MTNTNEPKTCIICGEQTEMTNGHHRHANRIDDAPIMKRIQALTQIQENRAVLTFLTTQINTEQKENVATARANGATWEEIGYALAITRSAAQKHYGG